MSLHHVELYVSDLARSIPFWDQVLTALGYEPFQAWAQGKSWIMDKTYIGLVQAEKDYLDPPHHRKRVGLNHLAFHATQAQLKKIIAELRSKNVPLLYGDKILTDVYPDADAIYFEDPDRMKIELIAPKQ